MIDKSKLIPNPPALPDNPWIHMGRYIVPSTEDMLIRVTLEYKLLRREDKPGGARAQD